MKFSKNAGKSSRFNYLFILINISHRIKLSCLFTTSKIKYTHLIVVKVVRKSKKSSVRHRVDLQCSSHSILILLLHLSQLTDKVELDFKVQVSL